MNGKNWSGVLCCCMVVLIGIWSEREALGIVHYTCGDGLQYPKSCEGHGGYKCKEGNKVGKELTDCLDYGGAVWIERIVCGDGWVEGIEECDDGAMNSDSLPNACRTSCRRAHCGDNVRDTGEDCDDGAANSDIVPNACRKNCRNPACGDGVLDRQFNEECDDGNQDESDGCRSNCTFCVRLTGSHFANVDTFLCRNSYPIASHEDGGAIIVQTPGIVVDCLGANLQGTGIGAGIYVRNADGVTIRNCTISGYAAGVRAVNSRNLIIEGNNNLNGNTRGIVLENSSRYHEGLAPGTTAPGAVQEGVRPAGGGAAAVGPTGKPVVPALVLPGAAGGPAVATPSANQVFAAPASFLATVADGSRGPVIFRVRSTDGGSFRAQSRDGRFAGIPAGGYCVEAALQKTPNAPGPCVPFRVTGATEPPGRAKVGATAVAPTRAATPIAVAPAVVAPTPPSRPTTPAPTAPAVVTPPAPLPAPAVARPALAVPPSAKLVTEGRRVFLDLNVAVARAEVYAGPRLLGRLPGGTRLEITGHIPNAVRGELIMHYFDARGTKTVQKVQVGSVRK